MFDKNYVLAELRNGRNYEDIMDEISRVLNEASKEFENEQKAIDKKQNKINDMQEILDLIYDYCIEYYGNSNEEIDKIDKMFENENAEKLVDLVDNCLELVDSIADLDKIFNLGKAEPKDEKVKINLDINNDFDKTLSDFLKLLK